MCKMKSPIRAAQNKQRGRMRPAGRQFDMPALHKQDFSFFHAKWKLKIVFIHRSFKILICFYFASIYFALFACQPFLTETEIHK